METIGYADFPERQRRARADGRYLGIGIGNGVKGTGRGPFESGIVRIGRSGRISVYTGAMPMGQGIKTALAQICAEQFDVAPDSVSVMAGDTAVIPYGQGGFASRQTITAGSAVHLAAAAVRDKALKVAAHLLETSLDDLEIRDGRVEIAGVPEAAWRCARSPRRCRAYPATPCRASSSPASKACKASCPTRSPMAAAATRSRSRSTSRPAACGFALHRGQRQRPDHQSADRRRPALGGTAHGIGNSLYEWMGYDEQAQPITTTFADYLLPTATEVPNIEVTIHRISLAAQSARRQGRRRIGLRAGRRRDHLGGRERARAVRRAHHGISGDAGPAVRAAAIGKSVMAGSRRTTAP